MSTVPLDFIVFPFMSLFLISNNRPLRSHYSTCNKECFYTYQRNPEYAFYGTLLKIELGSQCDCMNHPNHFAMGISANSLCTCHAFCKGSLTHDFNSSSLILRERVVLETSQWISIHFASMWRKTAVSRVIQKQRIPKSNICLDTFLCKFTCLNMCEVHPLFFRIKQSICRFASCQPILFRDGLLFRIGTHLCTNKQTA